MKKFEDTSEGVRDFDSSASQPGDGETAPPVGQQDGRQVLSRGQPAFLPGQLDLAIDHLYERAALRKRRAEHRVTLDDSNPRPA